MRTPMFWFSLYFSLFLGFCSSEVIVLTNSNIDTVLKSHEVVLVDFYASWCYFSNILDPIFTEASNKVDNEYKGKGKAVLAKVDCEQEGDIAKKYAIRKYPTLKIFRFGEESRHEYRGARNVDAFVEFIQNELSDPVQYVEDDKSIDDSTANNNIIAYMKSLDSKNLIKIKQIARQLKEECKFSVIIKPNEQETLAYRAKDEPIKLYNGFDNADEMKNWIVKSCTPIVRNITFQNAEDITEEGRPLILLFYKPSEPEITGTFSKFVKENLMEEIGNVNFVYADGQKFSHPLMHLGKSENDLPLIAVDSFQHMFLLPNTVNEAVSDPKILKKFISDLQSGKLHREFHNGPDPEVPAEVPQIEKKTDSEQLPVDSKKTDQENVPVKEKPKPSPKDKTSPIPSVFKKLRPNSNRYTFHDEF